MSSRPPFLHHSTSYVPPHPTRSSSSSSSSSPTSSTPSSAHTPLRPYRDDYPSEKVEGEYHHLEHVLAPGTPRAAFAPLQDASRLHLTTHGTHGTHAVHGQRRSSNLAAGNGPPAGRCQEGGKLGRALILGWVVTTAMFIVATAFYKGELFAALDRLSTELREMGYMGQTIFALLIFLTTVPPLPLYSTLMVLSGYTFGAWDGFVISYLSSLIGAVVVFIVARVFLRDCIAKCLASSPTSMSLLSIIPARPHLLLLIRIAPYPYNLLNVILASSPTLTLRTYAGCTAISLLKVILHTWFGSGIHDISELHRSSSHPSSSGSTGEATPQQQHDGHDDIKVYWTWGGLALCVGLFVYLHHVAKKALARAQAEAERENQAEQGQSMVHVGQGL